MEIDVLKRLFLKACGAAAAGVLFQACGGGSAGASGIATGGTVGGGGESTSGGSGGGGAGTPGSLLQLVQQDTGLSALLAAVNKAGLQAVLDDGSADLTLFAPDNSAFDALAARLGLGDRNGLISALSPQQLADILRFHLVPQVLLLADLNGFALSNERPATLYSFGGDAAVLIFVHSNGSLNIWDGIGRSSITLTSTDVPAGNGVLHGLSDLVLPRHVLTVSQMLRASIDTFSSFSESLTPALIAELDGSGPFTVFAPANAAVAGLLSADAVRHHATRQLLAGDDFPPSPTTQTLTMLVGAQVILGRGGTALATLSDGATLQANVTDVDFFASNGVIHTIDHVLP
jgi:uncharacterized surface protein with fasciclin (FAS1) repeats